MPKRFPTLRRFFRLPVRPGSESEIKAELEFHFHQTMEDLVAGGMSISDAKAEAERRFGDANRYRRELHHLGDARGKRAERGELWDAMRQNLRFALRGATKSPGFTLAVTFTLGLGIGANAVMFGLIDRVLFRPPAHVVNPDQVRRLYIERRFITNIVTGTSITYPDLQDFRQVHAFSDVAGFFTTRLPLERGARAGKASAVFASHNFFSLLGVRPYHGRFYSEKEDAIGAPGTAVLGYRFWKSHFGESDSALGKALLLGTSSYTVIGVAPPGFTGVDLEDVDVFLPLKTAAHEAIGGNWATSRESYWVHGLVRLAPGSRLAAAEAEATARHRAGRAESKGYDPHARVIVGPLLEARGPDAPREVRVSLWLTGVSLALLIIACANVMNLLLARLTHRDRELAVRLALGAGRGRLVGQLITETLVLALLAAVAGLVIAGSGGALLRHTLLPDVTWSSWFTDWRVVLFTIAITMLAGLVSGSIPAWQSSRPDLSNSLKVGRGGPAMHRSRLRSFLLIFQASLSVVLLVCAGLFVRSLHQIHQMTIGMDLDHLVVATVDLKAAGYSDTAAADLQRAAMAKIARLPGVAGITGSNSIPFWSSWAEDLKIPGVDSIPRVPSGGPYINAVGPDYFRVVGTLIRQGRGFTNADHAGTARVAVVGETMAHLIWPGQSALGKCMIIVNDTMPCTEVVGVAADAPRGSLMEPLNMQYYVPAEQFLEHVPFEGLFVRASGMAETIVEPVRRTLQTVAPNLPYVEVRPFWQLTEQETRSWQLGATLFSIFGGLAMIVAAVGLYSVLSFSVARRTQEFGIRTALGASVGDVLGLVLRSGMRVVLIGLGLGLGIALLGARWIGPLLFHTSPRDPLVLGGVAVLLLLSATVACLVPALRATRVDPMEALRSE